MVGNNYSGRKALHAYVSDEVHAAWVRFSEENGVSMTGLLESLGLELLEEMRLADPEDIRRPWIKAGRRVDAKRRRRGQS